MPQRRIPSVFKIVFLLVYAVAPALSQESLTDPASTPAVPRVISLKGTLNSPDSSHPGVVGITLALYREQRGGSPLWIETQNVQLDAQGNYNVLLGASTNLPLELFTSGEARWLGVQMLAPGAEEQPRVRFVSVPYALRAADAERLGGKPLSAFVLAPESGMKSAAAAKSGEADKVSDAEPRVEALSTTAEHIAKFVDSAGTVGDSTITQQTLNDGISDITGVGVGTASANSNLHIQGSNKDVTFNFQNTGTGGHAYRFDSTNNGSAFGGGRLVLQDLTLGGVGRFSLDANGFVGFGTAAPDSNLHIVGSNQDMTFNFQNTGVGGRAYRWDSTHNSSVFGGGKLILQDLNAGGAARFALTADGNVGIGTSQPVQVLDVNGTVLGSNATVESNLGLPATGNSSFQGAVRVANVSFLHASGTGNSYIGQNAGPYADERNQSYNASFGAFALRSNCGSYSTAIGHRATDSDNGCGKTSSTSIGSYAHGGGSAMNITAIGVSTLGFSNFLTHNNTAVGFFALYGTGGASNTATGFETNTTGAGALNTATGIRVLKQNTTGGGNNGIGGNALEVNTTGANNTAIGDHALSLNTSGLNNTAIGLGAGLTATPANANVDGAGNTFIGYRTGSGTSTQRMLATAIGANALVSADNAIVLGDNSVSVGIGAPVPADRLDVPGDLRVGTDTTGCIKDRDGTVIAGTCSSDMRLKRNIEPFPSTLEDLVELQPVHFDWQTDEFPERKLGQSRSFGLIAQDVAKVLPDLVAEDADGYKAVRYSEIPTLLLQALRELKAENESLKEQIQTQLREFQSELEELKKRAAANATGAKQ
jgi:hypothetical protein